MSLKNLPVSRLSSCEISNMSLLNDSGFPYDIFVNECCPYKGLCITCKNIKNCIKARYEGGIWHCACYVERD